MSRIPRWMMVVVLAAAAARAQEPEMAIEKVERALKNPAATGLLISQVGPGSQADEKGVEPGDVLVKYGTSAITDLASLRPAIQAAMGSESVTCVFVRANGERVEIELKPGTIGISGAPVEKGKPVADLPPATGVAFDLHALTEGPREDWYAFFLGDGRKCGFEHGIVRLEGGKLLLRREVAFDGGEQWGVNHMDVTVTMRPGAVPAPLSVRFAMPVAKVVMESTFELDEKGDMKVAFQTTGPNGEEETGERKIAGDLPLLPSYAIEFYACHMPREKGACFHFRPVIDGNGEPMIRSALYCAAEEEIEHAGEKRKVWRMEWRKLDGADANTYWVDAEGRALRCDYGGARATLATRADALKDLHADIKPLSAG